MQSVNRALLLGVMVLLAAAVACGGGEEEAAAAAAAAAAEAEIEVSPEARAAAERLSERLAAGISLVPTQRGQAEIGYTQPVARRGTGSERGFNITSIRIRNLSQNAIAGFQVDEFWYDQDGNTVTGDQARRGSRSSSTRCATSSSACRACRRWTAATTSSRTRTATSRRPFSKT